MRDMTDRLCDNVAQMMCWRTICTPPFWRGISFSSKVYFLTTLNCAATIPPGFCWVTLLWQRRRQSSVKSRTQISYGSFSSASWKRRNFTSPKLGVPQCAGTLGWSYASFVSHMFSEIIGLKLNTNPKKALWWASVEKCVYNLEHLRDIVPRNIIVPFLNILSKEWGMV